MTDLQAMSYSQILLLFMHPLLFATFAPNQRKRPQQMTYERDRIIALGIVIPD